MKTAIIIHGMSKKERYLNPKEDGQSNSHWIPWLQQQLCANGILTQTPEMPEPYYPQYDKWSSIFSQFILTPETILIGHSCGGGFILKWLSQNNIRVGKVILVAPWINVGHTFDVPMFDNLELKPDLVEQTKGITILGSSNDYPEIQESILQIRATIKNTTTVAFENYGHFCFKDMKTREFPELADIALSDK